MVHGTPLQYPRARGKMGSIIGDIADAYVEGNLRRCIDEEDFQWTHEFPPAQIRPFLRGVMAWFACQPRDGETQSLAPHLFADMPFSRGAMSDFPFVDVVRRSYAVYKLVAALPGAATIMQNGPTLNFFDEGAIVSLSVAFVPIFCGMLLSGSLRCFRESLVYWGQIPPVLWELLLQMRRCGGQELFEAFFPRLGGRTTGPLDRVCRSLSRAERWQPQFNGAWLRILQMDLGGGAGEPLSDTSAPLRPEERLAPVLRTATQLGMLDGDAFVQRRQLFHPLTLAYMQREAGAAFIAPLWNTGLRCSLQASKDLGDVPFEVEDITEDDGVHGAALLCRSGPSGVSAWSLMNVLRSTGAPPGSRPADDTDLGRLSRALFESMHARQTRRPQSPGSAGTSNARGGGDGSSITSVAAVRFLEETRMSVAEKLLHTKQRLYADGQAPSNMLRIGRPLAGAGSMYRVSEHWWRRGNGAALDPPAWAEKLCDPLFREASVLFCLFNGFLKTSYAGGSEYFCADALMAARLIAEWDIVSGVLPIFRGVFDDAAFYVKYAAKMKETADPFGSFEAARDDFLRFHDVVAGVRRGLGLKLVDMFTLAAADRIPFYGSREAASGLVLELQTAITAWMASIPHRKRSLYDRRRASNQRTQAFELALLSLVNAFAPELVWEWHRRLMAPFLFLLRKAQDIDANRDPGDSVFLRRGLLPETCARFVNVYAALSGLSLHAAMESHGKRDPEGALPSFDVARTWEGSLDTFMGGRGRFSSAFSSDALRALGRFMCRDLGLMEHELVVVACRDPSVLASSFMLWVEQYAVDKLALRKEGTAAHRLHLFPMMFLPYDGLCGGGFAYVTTRSAHNLLQKTVAPMQLCSMYGRRYRGIYATERARQTLIFGQHLLPLRPLFMDYEEQDTSVDDPVRLLRMGLGLKHLYDLLFFSRPSKRFFGTYIDPDNKSDEWYASLPGSFFQVLAELLPLGIVAAVDHGTVTPTSVAGLLFSAMARHATRARSRGTKKDENYGSLDWLMPPDMAGESQPPEAGASPSSEGEPRHSKAAEKGVLVLRTLYMILDYPYYQRYTAGAGKPSHTAISVKHMRKLPCGNRIRLFWGHNKQWFMRCPVLDELLELLGPVARRMERQSSSNGRRFDGSGGEPIYRSEWSPGQPDRTDASGFWADKKCDQLIDAEGWSKLAQYVYYTLESSRRKAAKAKGGGGGGGAFVPGSYGDAGRVNLPAFVVYHKNPLDEAPLCDGVDDIDEHGNRVASNWILKNLFVFDTASNAPMPGVPFLHMILTLVLTSPVLRNADDFSPSFCRRLLGGLGCSAPIRLAASPTVSPVRTESVQRMVDLCLGRWYAADTITGGMIANADLFFDTDSIRLDSETYDDDDAVEGGGGGGKIQAPFPFVRRSRGQIANELGNGSRLKGLFPALDRARDPLSRADFVLMAPELVAGVALAGWLVDSVPHREWGIPPLMDAFEKLSVAPHAWLSDHEPYPPTNFLLSSAKIGRGGSRRIERIASIRIGTLLTHKSAPLDGRASAPHTCVRGLDTETLNRLQHPAGTLDIVSWRRGEPLPPETVHELAYLDKALRIPGGGVSLMDAHIASRSNRMAPPAPRGRGADRRVPDEPRLKDKASNKRSADSDSGSDRAIKRSKRGNGRGDFSIFRDGMDMLAPICLDAASSDGGGDDDNGMSAWALCDTPVFGSRKSSWNHLPPMNLGLDPADCPVFSPASSSSSSASDGYPDLDLGGIAPLAPMLVGGFETGGEEKQEEDNPGNGQDVGLDGTEGNNNTENGGVLAEEIKKRQQLSFKQGNSGTILGAMVFGQYQRHVKNNEQVRTKNSTRQRTLNNRRRIQKVSDGSATRTVALEKLAAPTALQMNDGVRAYRQDVAQGRSNPDMDATITGTLLNGLSLDPTAQETDEPAFYPPKNVTVDMMDAQIEPRPSQRRLSIAERAQNLLGRMVPGFSDPPASTPGTSGSGGGGGRRLNPPLLDMSQVGSQFDGHAGGGVGGNNNNSRSSSADTPRSIENRLRLIDRGVFAQVARADVAFVQERAQANGHDFEDERDGAAGDLFGVQQKRIEDLQAICHRFRCRGCGKTEDFGEALELEKLTQEKIVASSHRDGSRRTLQRICSNPRCTSPDYYHMLCWCSLLSFEAPERCQGCSKGSNAIFFRQTTHCETEYRDMRRNPGTPKGQLREKKEQYAEKKRLYICERLADLEKRNQQGLYISRSPYASGWDRDGFYLKSGMSGTGCFSPLVFHQ